MPILDLAGFLLTGVLSGLLAGLFGVGGGAIMVPALILLFAHLGIGGDWGPHLAVGTSLAVVLRVSILSALYPALLAMRVTPVEAMATEE